MITASGVQTGVTTSPVKALSSAQRVGHSNAITSNVPAISVVQPSATRLPVNNISANSVYSVSPGTIIPVPYKVTTPVQVAPNTVANAAVAGNITAPSSNIPATSGLAPGMVFNQAPTVAVPPPSVQSQPQQLSSPANQSASSLQKLKVEDALTYLDQVKFQFGATCVYNEFLEIMKQFKSHTIDTPGVIQRVSDLFKGHPRLILGFNAFLPPGYQIRCINNSVHVITPGDVMQPLNAGPSNVPSVTENISTVTPSMNNAKSPASNQPLYYNRANAPISSMVPSTTVIARSVPPLIANHPPSHTVAQVQNRNPTPNVTGGGNVELVSEKQSPEFGRAISYVNKIKHRFINDPQTYQEFLDILTNYQKTSDSHDPQKPSSRMWGDKEVYNRVSILFKKDQDLMEEFASFLPEMTGMLVPKKRTPPPLTMPSKVYPPKANFPGQQKQPNAAYQANLQAAAQQNPRRRTLSNGSVVNVKSVPTAVAACVSNPSKVNAGITHSNKSQNSTSPNVNSIEVVPSKRPRMANVSDVHLKSEGTLVNTRSEFAMFDEIRTILQSDARGNSSPHYNDFIKSLSLLNRKIVSREEFASMVKPLFLERKQRNSHCLVFKWLLEFLGLNSTLYCKNSDVNQDHRVGKSQRGFQVKEDFDSHDENLDCNGELNESDNSKGTEYCKPEVDNVEVVVDSHKKVSVDCESTESVCSNELSGKNTKEAIDELQFGTDLLYTYPQHGTSYRIVPPHLLADQTPPIGLSKSISDCLNSQYRVVSSISGEFSSSSYASRKSYSLEYMHRIDDERFEFDMLLETNQSAIASLDFLQKAIHRASEMELQNFDLKRLLSPVNHYNLKTSANRVYGEKSEEILDSIFAHPKTTIPLVRSRLFARQEDWLMKKKAFCKTWNATSSKHALRALDFKGNAFKTTDTKNLRSKSLINDVERIYNEELYETEQIPSCITIDLKKTPNQQNASAPHLVERYNDKMTISDADKLTIYYLKRNCSNRDEKCRIKRLLKHLLKDLRYCHREALSDDEQSVNEEASEVEDTRRDKDLDLDDKEKFLDRSHDLQEILVPGNTGSVESTTDKDQCFLDREGGRRVLNHKRTFFCTTNWYLYFRLHLILCNRLAAIKQTCLHVVEKSVAVTQSFPSHKKSSDKNTTKTSVAVQLGLKKPNRVFNSGEELYEEFINSVCDLMDNKIDPEIFEDFVRQQLGLNSFECFTIDRLIHFIARQLQNIVSNDDNITCLKFLLEFYQVKPDHNSNSHSLMQYEYKFMENVQSPTNVFQVSFEDGQPDVVRVGFRMKSSESDPQFAYFENFKNWTDYITSSLPMETQQSFFKLRSDSGIMGKNTTLRKPVFLPRMMSRGQNCEMLQRRQDNNFLVFDNSDDFPSIDFKVAADGNQLTGQNFVIRKPFSGYRSKNKDPLLIQTHQKWKKIRFYNFTKWLRTKSHPKPQSDSPGALSCPSGNDFKHSKSLNDGPEKMENDNERSVDMSHDSLPKTDVNDGFKLAASPKKASSPTFQPVIDDSVQNGRTLSHKSYPSSDRDRCNSSSMELKKKEAIEQDFENKSRQK